MMRPQLFRPAIATLFLWPLLLAGCLGKGTVEPPRFYLLDSLPMQGSPSADAPSIGVGPVSLPEYLDRPQLVTRSSGNEIHLADFARWGAPLNEQVPRVLAENLSALLRTDRISVFPRKATDTADFQVVVEVIRLDADDAGNAVLNARWSVLRKGVKEALHSKRSEHKGRAEAKKGYDAAAAAESLALQDLSREIAAVVQGEARKGAGH